MLKSLKEIFCESCINKTGDYSKGVKSYTFLVVFTLMSPSALHTSTTASPGCQCIIDGI